MDNNEEVLTCLRDAHRSKKMVAGKALPSNREVPGRLNRGTLEDDDKDNRKIERHVSDGQKVEHPGPLPA